MATGVSSWPRSGSALLRSTALISLSLLLVTDAAIGAGLLDGDGSEPQPLPSCNGQPATIVAQPGIETIGSHGNDRILGTQGPDEIDGRGGNDQLCGLRGDDVLAGGGGDDGILADPGADTVSGGAGNDFVYGRRGRDAVEGGGASDFLTAGEGSDVVRGGTGDDRLFGGPEDDQLAAGGGSDSLGGGTGHDEGSGGDGWDECPGDKDGDRLESCLTSRDLASLRRRSLSFEGYVEGVARSNLTVELRQESLPRRPWRSVRVILDADNIPQVCDDGTMRTEGFEAQGSFRSENSFRGTDYTETYTDTYSALHYETIKGRILGRSLQGWLSSYDNYSIHRPDCRSPRLRWEAGRATG